MIAQISAVNMNAESGNLLENCGIIRGQKYKQYWVLHQTTSYICYGTPHYVWDVLVQIYSLKYTRLIFFNNGSECSKTKS